MILHEELTKRSAGNNITSMLFIFDILVPIDSECAASNIRNIGLAHYYQKNWLLLVGYGLIKIRIKYFVDEINKFCYYFSEQQEVLEIIKEALDKVINVTVDLHRGLIHFILDSYSLVLT